MRAYITPRNKRLLFALLIINCVFIGLHVLVKITDFSTDPRWLVTHDGGFAEIFQYGQEIAIIGCLLVLGWINRSPLYLTWAQLFGYLLLDDMFLIHERLGLALSGGFGFMEALSLRPRDAGELFVLFTFSLIFFILIGLAYATCRNHDARTHSVYLLGMVGLLIFFGVGLDIVHMVVADSSRLLDGLFGLLEDGGEQIVMGVVVWLMFALLERQMLDKIPADIIPTQSTASRQLQ